MFGRKDAMNTAVDTLVGENTKISGDLVFTGRCHVDGDIKGNVSADTDSNSALSISEGGNIEGGVTAPFVILHGIVRGDVFASQRIELGATARVIGNVYYNLIEMKVGAEINGKLVHQPQGKVPLIQSSNDQAEPSGAATASTS